MSHCQVSTYSGGRLHERPVSFTRGDEWLAVREILKQWYAPDHLYFQVVAGDGRVYLLSYHRFADSWEVSVCGPPE